MKRTFFATALALMLLIVCVATPILAEDATGDYPYMKDGEIDLLGYFDIQGATATLQESSIDFSLTAETATITFKKPLAADGFSFRWNGVDDSKRLLQSIAVTLTDSQNADVALKATFGQMGDSYVSVRYNDDPQTYLASASMYKVNQTDVSLNYFDESRTLTDEVSYSIDTRYCVNGNSFDGFASQAVNMTLTVTGKVGGTFSLKSINAQRFGTQYQWDNVEPSLSIPNTLTKALHGSVVTLPAASAWDVLSNTATMTLTVTDPSGEIAVDVDGTKLENVDGTKVYRLKMAQYGQYRLSYVASDGLNKSRGIGYQINVMDANAPTITLDGKVPARLKVGEAFAFPAITVSDNVEGDIVTWINVRHPEGHITYEKTDFTPETEGKYVLTFTAVDASGNVGRLTVETYAEGGK